MSDLGKQIVLFIVVLCTRLPFLFAGYGVEEDSWGHVLNAALINETGIYEVSRLPGHPLLESLLLIGWNVHSPFLYNLFAALVGAGSAVVFYRILKKKEIKMALAWAFAFSMVPVVYISSTYTIDYMFALMFILLAYEAILNEKTERAAIWLAVATGFRITSLAMLVPFGYYVLRDKSSYTSFALRARQMSKLVLISVLVGALFYYPAYQQYGIGFFDFHKPPYPNLLEAFYKMTIGPWGVLGILAIILGKLFAIQKGAFNLKNSAFTTLLFTFLVYAIAYFRMPEKAAFWLPVVPFFILLVAEHLKKLRAKFILGLFIASPLLFGINKTDAYTGSNYSPLAITTGSPDGQLFLDPIQGPVLNDYSKRLNKLEACEKIEYQLMIQRQRTLVIAGWWYAMLEVDRRDGKWSNRNIELVYFASPAEMATYKKRGYTLMYLPGLAEINDQKYQTNYTVLNATLMPIE